VTFRTPSILETRPDAELTSVGAENFEWVVEDLPNGYRSQKTETR
jgi:hypothetical protein